MFLIRVSVRDGFGAQLNFSLHQTLHFRVIPYQLGPQTLLNSKKKVQVVSNPPRGTCQTGSFRMRSDNTYNTTLRVIRRFWGDGLWLVIVSKSWFKTVSQTRLHCSFTTDPQCCHNGFTLVSQRLHSDGSTVSQRCSERSQGKTRADSKFPEGFTKRHVSSTTLPQRIHNATATLEH